MNCARLCCFPPMLKWVLWKALWVNLVIIFACKSLLAFQIFSVFAVHETLLDSALKLLPTHRKWWVELDLEINHSDLKNEHSIFINSCLFCLWNTRQLFRERGKQTKKQKKNNVICYGMDGKGLNAASPPCFGGFRSGLAQLIPTGISLVLA